MATLNELYDKLNTLKEEGKIVEWKTIRDNGEIVIINIGYPTDEDVVNYENVAVRVYNRGTENEFIRWEKKKPTIVMEEVPTQFEEYIESKKAQILQDLKEKYNTIKLIGFNINKDREYVTVRAFVDNGDNTISEKEFVVIFDESGNYKIYEKA